MRDCDNQRESNVMSNKIMLQSRRAKKKPLSARTRKQRLNVERLELRQLLAVDFVNFPQPTQQIEPVGARGYDSDLLINLAVQGETDQASITLSTGQKFSTRAVPANASLLTQMQLVNSSNGVLASVSAVSAGSPISFSDIPILADGTYRILVTSLSGSGNVGLSAFTGTTLEAEPTSGLNNSIATSENLTGKGLSIAGNGIRYLISGNVTNESDWYRFPVTVGQSIEIRGQASSSTTMELTAMDGTVLVVSEAGLVTGYKAESSGEIAIRVNNPTSTSVAYTFAISVDATLADGRAGDFDRPQRLSPSGVGYGWLSAGVSTSRRVAVHANPNDSHDQNLINQLNNDTYFDFDAVRVVTSQIDSLAELSQYDVVVLGTPYTQLSVAAAEALRDYYLGGGGVVATGWFSFAYSGVGASSALGLPLDQILPVAMGSGRVTNSSTLTPSATHPIMQGITQVSFNGQNDSFGSFDTDATILARTVTGSPAVAVRESAGRSVYLAPAYYWTYTDLMSGSGDQLLEQAVAWAARANSEDSFSFVGQASTPISVTAALRDAGVPNPSNDAIVSLTLHYLDGTSPAIPVATSSGVTAGVAPAVLSYTPPAGASGRYSVRIRATSGSGEYDVLLTGGTETPPEGQLSVVSTSLPSQPSVNFLDSTLTVNFNRPVLLSSINASDLVVGSTPALGYTVIDSNTVQFDISNVDVGDGLYAVSLSSMTGVDGTALAPYSTEFTLDRVAPRVTDVSYSADISGDLATLTFFVNVDEALDPNSIASFPFDLVAHDLNNQSPLFSANSVTYEPAQNRVVVGFTGIPQSRYTFSIDTEFNNVLLDLAGNSLDAAGNGQAYSVLQIPLDIDLNPAVPQPTALAPLGAGLSAIRVESVAGVPGDADEFPMNLEAGAIVAISLKPFLSSNRLQLELLGPSGAVLSTQTSPIGGGKVQLPTIVAASAGLHRVRVTSVDGLGRYEVTIGFGAGREAEIVGGANDTILTAETPSMSPRVLAGSATTTAVAGRIGREVSLSIDEIGFTPEFGFQPLSITASTLSGSDFLLTTGSELYTVNLDGTQSFLSSLFGYVPAIASNGTDLLGMLYGGRLDVINPTTGQSVSTQTLQRVGGGSIFSTYSMARLSSNELYVLFEGSGISGRALGRVDLAAGTLTLIGTLNQDYASIAVDALGNVLAILPEQFNQGASVYELDVSNGLESSLVHRFEVDAPNSVIGFSAAGELYRATAPLNNGGGEGGVGEGDIGGFIQAAGATLNSGDWQRLILTRSNDLTDVHRVSLAAGQWLSLALSNDQVKMELLDSSGQLVSVGTTRGDLSAIEGFIAPTAGTFFVRLTHQGLATDYQLVISHDANLELPAGNIPQAIPPSGIVYGQSGGTNGGGSVVIDQSTSIPRVLFDSANYRWDIQSNGSIGDGTTDAYDGGMNLDNFNGGAAFQDASGRSVRLGPSAVAGLSTVRQVYVPANDTFARFIDSFTNNTTNAITATISYNTNLGSDGSETNLATSSGDLIVGNDDRWILTDDFSVAGGDPAVGHLFSGPGSLQPTFVSRPSGSVIWRYSITVTPGQTVSLMSYAVQNYNRTLAEQAVRRVASLSDGTLANLPVGIAGTIINWPVDIGVSFEFDTIRPTSARIATSTPGDATGLPLNAADPRLSLHYLDGTDPNQAVATNDNGASDGRNALLNYSVTAGTLGRYGFSVGGFPVGDYVAVVSGTNPGDVVPINLLTADFSNVAADDNLLLFPSKIRVHFNSDLNLLSVAASDLRINGLPAQSVDVIDGRTLEFDVANSNVGDGNYILSMSGASLTSLSGAALSAITRSFNVDSQAPVVVASTVLSGDTVSPGDLLYQVTFSERLNTTGFGPEDFTLTAVGGSPVVANSMIYDPVSSVATVTFAGLIETNYTLRILSSANAVRDVRGNLLDGSPSFPLPSGDGTAGGDFIVSFSVDASTTALPTPSRSLLPPGGRIYISESSALIGQPADVDRFVIQLKAGQSFFASASSLSTLAARVRVLDPLGNELAQASGTSGGVARTLQLLAPVEGSYTLLVESADGSIGAFRAAMTLGAAPELESVTSLSNDSIALAQGLSFLSALPTTGLGPQARLASVVGQGGSLDHFAIPVTAGRVISIAAALTPAATSNPSGGLSILSVDGTLLAVGSDRSDGVVQDISEYVPQADGILIIRIDAAAGSTYQLVVAENAAIDIEPNDNVASAQSVQIAPAVLGGIAIGGTGFTVDFADTVGALSLEQFAATGIAHVTNICGGELPGHSAPNIAYFGIDSSCDFNNGTVSGTLTSPPLGLRTSPSLNLKYRLGGESSLSYDRAEVQVSTNGGATFTTIATKATHFAQASNWTATSIDLSAFAGLTAIIRFSFNSIDSVSNTGIGWQIDDIEVTGVADLQDHFKYSANVGDNLVVRAIPYESAGTEPSGTLAPQLELVGPDGLVIASGSGVVNYAVPAGGAGAYIARIFGSGAGDYRADFAGSTANGNTAARVVSQVPQNNQSLANAPTKVQLTFDQGVRLDSVHSTDIVFANTSITTTGVEVVDGSTIAFLVNIPEGIDGALTYSIAGGSILDLQGTPIAPIASSFTIDRVGPRVIDTAPSAQASAPFSSLTFVFNEPVDRDTVDVNDILAFTSPAGANLRAQITSVTVDGPNVTVRFSNQITAGEYQMTIGGNIRDVVGNLIDQNGNGIGGESADVFTRTIALQSPDLTALVNSVSGATVFGQTLTVNYTVRNSGNDPARERWLDRVYLSTNTTLDRDDRLLLTSPTTNSLGPLDAVGGANASYTRSVDVALPLSIDVSAGTYYLLVETDSSRTQPETNENNNVAPTAALSITLPPIPDLVIEAVVIPTAALSGQQIPVQWRLANRGTGAFTGTLVDTVRLSTDAVVGNDSFLANFSFTGTIPAGGSVIRQQLVTLPIATQGPRYLVLTTDSGNSVFEHVGENNNNTVSSVIDVTLAPLPNLRVTSVTAPTGAFSGQSTQINFVVTNTGSGPTNAPVWYDAVYLSIDGILDSSDIYLGAQVNPGYLEPAASYASSLLVNLPRGIQGDYQIIIHTDFDDRVFENQFENDNVTPSVVFPVTLTPPPDLRVQSVTGPFSAFSGQNTGVSWTIVNSGPGRTQETSWVDDVYLSSDAVLDNNDVRLRTVGHSGALASGATYSVVNQPVTLPVGIQGNYYFIVVTDSRNNVYENVFEGNNIGASSAVTDVRLTPPPDLVPEFTTVPTSLSAGRDISVAFTVSNLGITPTVENSWSDRLYLSADNVLDANDLIVQTRSHFGNLGVFQSYSDSFSTRLPWTLIPGNYFLILAADTTNNVFELDNVNNVIVSSSAIPLTIAAPDLVPTGLAAPAAALAGQPISVSWTVQNNGIGSTNATRRDYLYLSTDNVFGNADDRFLKEVSVNTVLLPGASQTVSADNVLLPLELASANYNLYVRVDGNQAQFESNESNNDFGPRAITIAQTLPDLVAESITFNPSSLNSQGQLTVDWLTRNQGAAVTNVGYWVDRVYLSVDGVLGGEDILIGTLSQNAVLEAGATRSRQGVFNLSAEISGNYFVIVATDHNGQVFEGVGESNNVSISSNALTITLAPVPDLQVITVSAPLEAFSGQTLDVSWTVRNLGTAEANGSWYDAIYLSADQVFDRNTDTYLGFRNRPAALGVGQSYNQTAQLSIPPGIAGPLYVFVATDSGNQIFERSAELNNTAYDSVPVNVILLPPADLVVGTINIPPDSTVGANVTIAYTVQNLGVNPARGQWQDSLFLSRDGVYSIDDMPLGTVLHTGDVAGGGEYSAVLSTRLPGAIPGDYKIIVRSDIRNAIVESNESNNLRASLDTFAIDLPQLTLGVAATGQLNVGESLFWTIQLTKGDSVRFRLDNASNDATSELFIRRGSIPTRGQFDFAANVPFTNDPSVVIPVEATGVYFVMAYGSTGGGNNNFSLLAEIVPLSLFDVRATSIGNSAPATVKISGAKFDSDTVFSLVSPTDSAVVLTASDVYLKDSVTAFVTFNANDFPNGTYNLTAQNAGALATLPAALTVGETVEGDILVLIDGPPRVRPDRFNPFRIQYTNDGNTDVSSPLLIVENPNGLEIGFTPDDVGLLPLHLFAVAPDGVSDVLRPGTIGSIPVIFRSNSDGIVNMPVRPIRDTDPRLLTDNDWARIEASIRPSELTAQQWSSFWARIQPRIGSTWGAYVRFVQNLHERTADLGVRKGDVRSMILGVYEDDPNWRPSSIVSGRLLTSTDAASIAAIPIAAYRVTSTTHVLESSTITAADGSFSFAALPAGDYVFSIEYENHFFDLNRNGIIDNDPPGVTVAEADVGNVLLYVMADSGPVVTQAQPSMAVDSTGTSHIVWLENQQLWHAVGDGSGQWIQAQAIADAMGSDPVLITGEHLVDNSPGLMVVYRTGTANAAELFYVIGKLNDTRTAYLWSAPVAMTSDAVHDGGFDAGVASNGKPVVLSQRLSVGGETTESDDDADIYSWSETPSGSFEAALLAAFEQSLIQSNDLPELGVEGGSVRFRIQNIGLGPKTIPSWVPYLGGKYEVNFRASANVAASGCSASGQITGEGQVKFSDYVEGNIRGSGGVEYSAKGAKGSCEYEFDNAFVSAGGGAAGDIPFAKLPGLGKIEANAGIRLEGQVAANFRWNKGSNFPSWPDKVDGSLRVGIGGFAKGKSSFGWLGGADLVLRVLGNASWRINSLTDWDFRGFSVTVLARAEIKVKNPITGTEYKKFKEFTFNWNSSDGANSNALSELGGSIDTNGIQALEATSPENFTFGIEPIPSTSAGTLTDYGTSTFSVVAQDRSEDTRPTIATAPNGEVYGLWSNSGGVRVHRYNPATDTWTLIGTVGDDTALATRDAKLAFDSSGKGFIVFAGQDYSGLSESSTSQQIAASFDQGSDLYYATFDTSTNTFSNDLPLFSLTGDDSGVSLMSLPGGDMLAIWTHTDSDISSGLYSARWNASTMTWSAGTLITSAVTIGSRPAISMVAGVPTAMWSQTNSAVVQGQFDTTAPSRIMVSKFVAGAWTTPANFAFGALVSSTRLAATSGGDQVQIFTNLDGDLKVITRNSVANSWAPPVQLSTGGNVRIDSASVAYDASGLAVAVWIETMNGNDGAPIASVVTYSSLSPLSNTWSSPIRLAVGGTAQGQLQLAQDVRNGLLLVWTEGNAADSQALHTATWSSATRSFDATSTRARGVTGGSVSTGSVGGDTVLLWRRAASAQSLDRGVTYSVFGDAGWGQAIAAQSLIHEQTHRRSPEVTREAAREQALDQYGLGMAHLLSHYLGGSGMLLTGAGIYLRTAGVLPFSPPEECCDCEKLEERTVGTDEGCGSSVEIDQENCIRITTYKPCVERPRDPNDILGPEGFGEERWVQSDDPLSYRIRFENAADASAAAQLVEVTQTLDQDLQLQSFGITGFGFRGFNFTVPNAPPFYTTILDMTEQLGVLVEFTAGINVSTREAFWRLVALDPATGQPPLNPDLGLLIPNDADGNGEGYLDYRILPKPGVPTGTRIDAQARIIFDTEEPIDTPPIFNTLDASAPTSGVIVGTAPGQPEFTVSWTGADESNGSGLSSYTILVSTNGGEYSIWLDETTATEAVYTGTPGSTYSFVSIAADNTNHLEAIPETADWTVTLGGGIASIGDFVWDDLNNNGLQDAEEPGINGVTVTLFRDNGTAAGIELQSVVTAGGGAFSFPDIPTDGSYFLTIAAPSGYGIGKALQGTNPSLDSDFASDGKTAIFTVAGGENFNYDGALVQLGSIAGTVWEDIDGDGIRDSGEPGMAGWTIYLDINDNGALDSGEPSRVSGNQGQYLFDALLPGSYIVAEVVKAGFMQTFPGSAGASSTDRSYVRSGSQASLSLPAMEGLLVGPAGGPSSSTQNGSAASRLIGLDRFLSDPRFVSHAGGTVVIIDTGIDVDHPFFGPDSDSNGVADRIVYQYDFADNDADASDETGHGSHVAGLVAGGDATYPGVAPNANIIALKVFSDNGRGTFSDVERALAWVIQNATRFSIDAVNLSIGDGMNWSDTIGGYGISDELAVLANIGVISVAAAGNGYGLFNQQGLAYPAADPNTISVGAVWDSNRSGPWNFGANGTDYTTGAGRITSFSQRDADTLDVFAPGAILTGANQFGGVSAMRGTSMASPQVAGAAVWAQQLANATIGRNLTTAEFRYLVRQSGTRMVDGDDESDNVFNTGATYAGLNLVALGEAILAYNGNYVGSGFNANSVDSTGSPRVANGRPNRYVIELAPGQDRVVVDFGNKALDTTPPQVVSISTVTPGVRNTGVAELDIVFSEAIAPTTFTTSDFTLQRGANTVSLSAASLTQINATTWRLSGLGSLTAIEGAYTLTLLGSSVTDIAGNVGIGTATSTFSVDTTSPVGTVQALGTTQSAATFAVTVAGSDPISNGVSSGVAVYEIYKQVDGSAFQFWTSVPASNPTANYTGLSGQTLGFYAIAVDAAGNRESGTPVREVVTRMADVDAPVTSVTTVNTATPTLLVGFSGTDAGGSGLVRFEIMVGIDGAAPVLAGTVNNAASNSASGSLNYPAIRDGSTHTYRFFSVGVDAAGNREAVPGVTQDVTVMVAFEAPQTPEVTLFDVQKNQTNRSFVRYIDTQLSHASAVDQIVASLADANTANDRAKLERFALTGGGPATAVSLTGKVQAVDRVLAIDFGSKGLPGAASLVNPQNSNTVDGYYRLSLDLDGNISNGYEAQLHFYRLLGDINGDRSVNSTDLNLVNSAITNPGSNPGADANGDGLVSNADRIHVTNAQGRQLSSGLPLND